MFRKLVLLVVALMLIGVNVAYSAVFTRPERVPSGKEQPKMHQLHAEIKADTTKCQECHMPQYKSRELATWISDCIKCHKKFVSTNDAPSTSVASTPSTGSGPQRVNASGDKADEILLSECINVYKDPNVNKDVTIRFCQCWTSRENNDDVKKAEAQGNFKKLAEISSKCEKKAGWK